VWALTMATLRIRDLLPAAALMAMGIVALT